MSFSVLAAMKSKSKLLCKTVYMWSAHTQLDAISNERYTCWGNKDTHSATVYWIQCYNAIYRQPVSVFIIFLFCYALFVSLSTQWGSNSSSSSDNKSTKSTEGSHTDTLNLAIISIHMLDITGHIIWKLIVHANALSLATDYCFFFVFRWCFYNPTLYVIRHTAN